ncbi:MAG: twin-arginine translocase subunit TatB [Gammaproteobacteria bacterium]|jgi:sec-independent protein translocase protein TatB|nr:twin-arginine translocase subunit TatB [Gammaproteobacteria bacterium]
MFDFGFQELIVIFIVALVVLGPKRMQQLATTVGRWVGKARGMARQFREQLESEVNLDDLEKTTKSAAPFTPAPLAGLDGSPAPTPTPEATPENSNYPYGGTYPYGAPTETPPTDAAASGSSAAPQPGDDTYSHAHGTGSEPMPYLPPEAEGFDAAPPPVPLDSPMNADHGADFAPEPAPPAPASKDPTP